MITRRHTFAAVAAAASLVMTACAGGGASDTVGAAAAAEPASGGSTVNLFAYAVPKPGYDKLIPAFQATDAGKGVQFQQSYGASGDQSRKVEPPAPRPTSSTSRSSPTSPAWWMPAWSTRAGTPTSTRASRSARS